MFGILRRKLNSIVKLDPNKILRQILQSSELQDEIIYLNTIDQLFERGEDKLGRSLSSIGGGYSAYTISIKQTKGQPIDRVTLKDTGEYYASFKVVVADSYFEIIANPLKDGDDINTEWGGYTIGLQTQNLKKIIDEIRYKFVEVVKYEYRIS